LQKSSRQALKIIAVTSPCTFTRIENRMTKKSENSELIFSVHKTAGGGFTARALGESIFTQVDDRDSLEAMIRDAVACHFPDEQARPTVIRVHDVNEELAE